MTYSRPVVLSFSGHDPSGGAGIQADIEAFASHRCHAINVITALTEQDTRNLTKLVPQSPDNIVGQATAILADIPVKAFKIGLLGHADTVIAIHNILKQHPDIPVVLDPVLAAGGGTDVSSDQLIGLINELLLPLTTVLTPNSLEARRLTRLDNLNECGLALMGHGCEYVLITGTHENSAEVNNQLFHEGACIDIYQWNRLPHNYHGSGCTLAASIAALLAQGLPEIEAIAEAQEYTWNALAHAYQPGKGQHIPNRFYWVDNE